MRNFERCEKYYKSYGKFFEENKMPGPNAMWLIEILCEKMDLRPNVIKLSLDKLETKIANIQKTYF